jgi:hypothetical protein
MVSVVEEGQQQHHHYLQQLDSSSSYSLLVLAIRSPETKKKYLQRFGYFLDFVKIELGRPFEERCNTLGQLAKNDPKWITNCIFNYLQLLKNRVEAKEIKASTLRNNIKPIKLFCEQMDIDLTWKRLTRGMPKERKYANDRAPKLEEIIRITQYPDRRIKPIVYTMVSSGMRIGAWDYLRWKDISPVVRDDKVVAAKVKIYSEDEEEYYTFITPEAFHALDDWMNYRKECGENLNENIYYGASATGKTQICFTLCAMAQHEINGKAIYLDTENSFRPERIEAIAKARGFDSENILKSIHILKAFNSSSQEQIIKKKVRAFIEKEGKNIKLLVVDSVIAHYRAEFSGRALLSESD